LVPSLWDIGYQAAPTADLRGGESAALARMAGEL
jgi:hypothetical protein